jgi:hypothetical protein
VELYLLSPIRIRGVVLSLRKHRDDFALPYTMLRHLVTELRAGKSGFDSRKGWEILSSRPAVGPIQSLISVYRELFPR